jgi:hypothetical protein
MAANLTLENSAGVAQISPNGCGWTSADGDDEAQRRFESHWDVDSPTGCAASIRKCSGRPTRRLLRSAQRTGDCFFRGRSLVKASTYSYRSRDGYRVRPSGHGQRLRPGPERSRRPRSLFASDRRGLAVTGANCGASSADVSILTTSCSTSGQNGSDQALWPPQSCRQMSKLCRRRLRPTATFSLTMATATTKFRLSGHSREE